MLRSWSLSLRARVIAVVLGLQILLLAVIAGVALRHLDQALQAGLQAQAGLLGSVLAQGLEGPLGRRDAAAVSVVLQRSVDAGQAVHLRVRDPQGQEVSMRGAASAPGEATIRFFELPLGSGGGHALGTLEIGLSEGAAGASRHQMVLGLAVFGGTTVALSLALLWWSSRALTRPLRQLVRASRDIRAAQYRLDLPSGRKDEIGAVIDAFQEMSSEIERKLFQLTQSQELQRKYLKASLNKERELGAALEAAQAATRAKTDFLANISHEVRTPLNALLGFTQLLAASRLDDRQTEHVNRIRTAGKVLLRLIDDLLDVSKAEAGKLELSVAPLDLRRLVQRVVLLFGHAAERNQVSLQAMIDPGLAPALIGDALRLHQVLANLVSNAIKFTSRGSVLVAVECTESTAQGQRVRIRVRDTGIGMTSEQKALIFSPFVQADSSITRRFGGTGLGLSICKSLVDLMDGTLEVQSEPGRGSTFTVELWMAVSGEQEARHSDFGASSDFTTLSPAPKGTHPLDHSAWEDPVPQFEPTRPADLTDIPGEADREGLEPLLQQLEQSLRHNLLSAGQLLESIRLKLGPDAASAEFEALSRAVALLQFPQALGLLPRLKASIDRQRPR